MKKLLFGLMLAALAAPATAANFSGKWTMPLPISFGPLKQTLLQTLILNQVGNEVAGTLATGSLVPGASGAPVGTEIFDGKVEGDSISFYVWTGDDQPTKRYYKGTMTGEEITFTATGGSAPPGAGGPPAPQQLKAKRTK